MWQFLVNNYYANILAIDFGIQWVAWVFASFFKTEKFYDFTGSATFILLSWLSNSWSNNYSRQSIQTTMVIAWACRLGCHLFVRILKVGKDKRFDEAKHNPALYFFFWTIQAFWIFITLLPTLMLNNENLGDRPLGMQDYIGWSLWIIGMAFEGIADLQKSMFRNDPKNEGKFITSGLWSISRHPNYFGEILLWFGLYIAASSVFKKWQYLAVMSPMAVLWLITKYSGIPILEGYGQEKWGKLAQYQNYVANTPVLVPFWK